MRRLINLFEFKETSELLTRRASGPVELWTEILGNYTASSITFHKLKE